MRKPPIFALGMCAAALLGQVSLGLADQAQTSPQQGAPPQSQQTARQASPQKAQAPPPSPQTGQQTPAGPTPQTGKQASAQKTQAMPPSPLIGKQAPAQKPQAALGQQTGKQASGPKAQTAQPSQEAGKQASGQKAQAARPPAIPPGYRFLSLKEGRAIVQEMSWADDEEGLSPDCSHLVHKLYEQAGYAYPYASSLDLYRGAGPFLRVRYAHPGDLVVWRGHVGIVMNPQEHSFFSTTSSGARIQNYRSAYWRARGYPHFFRYLTKTPLKAANNGGTAEAMNHQSHH